VSLLRLEPEEVVAGGALQIGLWRGAEDSAAEDERAGRALVRVQGLLGPDGVCTPVLGGGRGAGDQVRLVPWGDERVPAADPVAPWPGRLPSPSPALVFAEPLVATVFDAAGAEVGVSGRHTVDAVPYQVSVAGRAPRRVRGWAGPWSVDERWWQPDGGARRTRLQVLVDDGDHGEAGLLLIRENGRWTVEGTYE
jgi:protein ImuB